MTLFQEEGPANTAAVAAMAMEAARVQGIEHLVVATCTGQTMGHFLPHAKEFRLTAVTHVCGFAGSRRVPDAQ